MPRGYKRKILTHPEKLEEWKGLLRNSILKVGFHMSLSRSMLEYLCAVADNVVWDRGVYRSIYQPDNWLAAQNALLRRGLIARKPDDVNEDRMKKLRTGEHDYLYHEWNFFRLTPAGEAVVSILKMAGIFEEQLAAIDKKARG